MQFDTKNFKHSNISKMYEGTKLCRLLETRWSGHLSMTKAILRNYTEILNVLEKVKGRSFVGEDKATALSLMIHLKKKIISIFIDSNAYNFSVYLNQLILHCKKEK